MLLLDAIVGETWDRLVYLFRFNPVLLAAIGVALVADTMTTAPFFRDPGQALKLGRLTVPMMRRHVMNPLHLVGPGVSILRSRSSKWMLQKLGREGVPVIAIHGDRDHRRPPVDGTQRGEAVRRRAGGRGEGVPFVAAQGS